MSRAGSGGEANRCAPLSRSLRLLSGLLVLGLLGSGPAGAATDALDPARAAELRDLLQRMRALMDGVEPLPQSAPAPLPAASAEVPGPATAGGIEEGTELLLGLRVAGYPLPEPLLARKRGEGFAAALSDFVAALEFPIEVDAEAGRASGWFIREANRFELDLPAGELRIRERSVPFDPDAIRREDGRILVPDALLAEWFGLRFDVDFRRLELSVGSGEPLPVQLAQQRRGRFNPNTGLAGDQPEYPMVPTEKGLVDVPLADVFLSTRLSDRGDDNADASLSYGLKLNNTLAGGNLESYLGGTDDDPLDTVRMTLRYAEPEGLGDGLPVTQLELGDVRSSRTPVVESGFLERGVRVSNLPLGAQLQFDTTVIEGNAFPGYDVELYRDGLLVGFQQAGEDGYYEFLDVPLFAGDNRFRLVFYGPQGQYAEEFRTIPLDASAAVDGPLAYEVTVTQQDHLLLDEPHGADESGARLAANLSYALTPETSIKGSFESFEDDGERRHLVSVGPAFNRGQLRGHVLAVADADGNSGVDALLQKRFDQANLRLRHREFGGLTHDRSGEQQRESESELALQGVFRPSSLDLPSVNYSLSASNERFTDGDRLALIGGQLSTAVGGVGLTSSLGWESADPGGEAVRGATQAAALFSDMHGRVRLGYELSPDPELESIQTDISWPFNRKLAPYLRFTRDFVADTSRLNAGLSYDAGSVLISPSVSIDDEEQRSILVNLRSGVGYDPQTGAFDMTSRPISHGGAVAVRVFLDEDGDGRMGPDERPVPGVEVLAPQARQSAVTNETGTALLTNIGDFQRSDVQLTRDTLPATNLAPVVEGVSVRGEAGAIHRLDFPVVRVWSVAGRVFAKRGPEDYQPLSGVEVRVRDLDDDTVVARARTGSEGGYAIDAVPRGRYAVELDPEALAARGLATASERLLTTNEAVDDYDRIDLVAAADAPVFPPLDAPLAGGDTYVPLGGDPGTRTEFDMQGPTRPAVALGGHDSKVAMMLDWLRLRRAYPRLLGPYQALQDPAQEQARSADFTSPYRLTVGPLASRDAAEALCDQLRAAGELCDVVRVRAAR